MDSDTAIDLKQFISAELYQQTVQLEARLDARIDGVDAKIDGLDIKIDGLDIKIEDTKNEILDAIGETTSSQNDIIDNHEARLTKLERRAA